MRNEEWRQQQGAKKYIEEDGTCWVLHCYFSKSNTITLNMGTILK